MVGSCEHDNERLGSTIGREILDWLSILLVAKEGLCSMEIAFFQKNRREFECGKIWEKRGSI
jgi:hypothetical protein